MPSNEAIVAGDERLSFADLDRVVGRGLRRAWSRAALRKGDRVGIAMRNCPAWIVSYMAILKAGAIATLLNGWWESHELDHALQLTEPKLIIADAARGAADRGALRQVRDDRPADRPADRARRSRLLDRATDAGIATARRSGRRTMRRSCSPRVRPGMPRAPLSTHRAVTTGAYTYANRPDRHARPADRGRPGARGPSRATLLSVPLFHVTGEVPVMLNSFVVGRCMVMMPKWDAGEALRLIEQEKITYFVGVPTMSLELMTHPDRDKYDLSSLTDIAAGGAPRPVSHVERLQQAFPAAQPALGYGLTETNAVGAHNFWGNYAAKPGSTGRAHAPFVELAILGAGDAHLPTGETGEIAIRTAANIRGYWNAPEATAALFTAEHLSAPATSATSTRTAICSSSTARRKSSFAAARTSPSAEVEAACYACPAVAEASVFGAARRAARRSAGGGDLTAESGNRRGRRCAHFLERRLAKFKIPEPLHLRRRASARASAPARSTAARSRRATPVEDSTGGHC